MTASAWSSPTVRAVGPVRHHREEHAAVARHALAHGAQDLAVGPLAEAEVGIGREVPRADAAGEDVGVIAEVAPAADGLGDDRLAGELLVHLRVAAGADEDVVGEVLALLDRLRRRRGLHVGRRAQLRREDVELGREAADPEDEDDQDRRRDPAQDPTHEPP